MGERTPKLERALLLAALALVAVATLVPTPRETATSAATSILCLVCGERGMGDVLANVILFLPLGLALGRLGWRARQAARAGLGLSLLVEGLQFAVVPGRDAALSDLLTNTAGAALGAAVASWLPLLLRPARPAAARLAALGWGLWLGQALLTAWALAPAPQPTPVWYGHRAHLLRGTVPFKGVLDDVRLDGRPLPDGVLPETLAFRRIVGSGRWTLEVELRGMPPVDGRAQVTAIAAGDGGFVLTLAQDGCTLRFRPRTRVEWLRLTPPEAWLADACVEAAGRAIVRAGVAPNRTWIELATESGVARRADLRLRPTLGWMILAPYTGLQRLPEVASAGWLLLTLVLPAYWSCMAARRRAALIGPAVALGGLGVASALSVAVWSRAWPSVPELLGALAAGVVASMVARRIRPHAMS